MMIVLRISSTVLVLSACLSILGVLAAPSAVIDWEAYERGHQGDYPQQTFESTTISAPVVHVEKWHSSCDSSSHVLLTPHGDRIRDNKALILDNQGRLVWHRQERGAVHTLQVQQYKGNHYLTYWVGDDQYWGFGRGYVKMLDQTYTIAYTISAIDVSDADYHEFSITSDDTALLTIYIKTPWDLTQFGRQGGYIWDCWFQEIDIETRELLFEWRASEHFEFDDMAVNSWAEWTGTTDDPWDWFHLNSVDKDDRGNYLLAARYTNAVTYVNGTDGSILWNLGGKRNSFFDQSAGNATSFVDPHMARWTDVHSALTLFDNVDFRTRGSQQQQSRGLKIQVDEKTRVAGVELLLVHPQKLFAKSEDSLQMLDSGNLFVSYGSSPVYSEFSADGEFLCSAHYAPMHTDRGAFKASELVQSYRVYKHAWTAHPKDPPDVKITSDTLYFSWNGATEVRSWLVQGRGAHGSAANAWEHIGTFERVGFETAVELGDASFGLYRLTAFDERGARLRAFHVHPDGMVKELDLEQSGAAMFASMLSMGKMVVVGAVGMLLYNNRRQFVGKWRNIA